MPTATTYNKDAIRDLLSEVKDPEIPVLSIIDLGILREIRINEDRVTVRITPTYSGCPAMKAIEKEIEKTLKVNGIQNYEIKKDFSETWTTDWMSEGAKKKLKDYGIAPPGKTEKEDDFFKTLKGSSRIIPCPYCDSTNTELQSEFGSTACKSQYYCYDCEEPFEHFKCI
ncbi:phenylacetate-CoA oxygenase subunit PaaJ [Aliifodinibius salicampi]|uniref:Phenylacetate-CoA oxygenase subunit PaaJ n=1 Tax=Fodinibius salicampi TaxID=1920655 RepID=A0ABT3PTW7_9BACT|nr:1,2-phenylacetyl-CoA epoxidase subunit PaaD [Fodinibius salicampi]MCW9711290.1 phenylacetate-CoA oxygenase subunit PaaJ [Fodinibius salicampi]